MGPRRTNKPEDNKTADLRSSHRGGGAGHGAGLPAFLEEHADQVADAVVAGDAAPAAMEPAAPRASDVAATDAGVPLDAGMRERIEPSVGADLSHVRVHSSASDRKKAGGMGARAFTHGADIWLGPDASSSDMKLMAHEATHVVHQAAPDAPAVQRQPAPTTSTTGTTDQMMVFVNNPALETDSGLRTVLGMLNQYKPTVDIGNVDFKVMTVTASYVGAGLSEDGMSHWDGNTPVIELTQDKYDTIAAHINGTASIGDVHSVVRTLGHEMYHLYRQRTGNKSNPIQPLFQAEANRRMDQVRQNWVDWAQDPGTHRELGLRRDQAVNKWEDIPADERKKIEEGAAQTSTIKGLYEQTAYLVEEIYVRIEELSYLRVQQKAETGPPRPSLAAISDVAMLVGRLSTALDSSVGNTADFMTPELLTKTRAAMLDYLRKRYPHRANPAFDSYEVIFYLTAKRSGMAPIYDDTGALVSVAPPEARVPPGTASKTP